MSATRPLFLVLHAPSADLEALQLLGISADDFVSDLSAANFQPKLGKVHIVDTQKLFMGWTGEKRQAKLFDCAKETGVQTTGIRPHNAGQCASSSMWRTLRWMRVLIRAMVAHAGNDAVLTRLAFEMMMTRDRAL